MSRWKRFNNNPSGRSVGDCSIRALSVALGIDWETAYALAALNGYLMNDVISSNSVWGSVLRQNGFFRHSIESRCPDCYTMEDFAKDHPSGTFVVCTGNHVATIRDGLIWDSWDSSREVPQFYWSREE